MKLLLVEDNQDLALWLGKVLREEQFDVDTVHDGEAAIARLEQTPYDLLLLDLKLPGLDGRSVLRRLRRQRNDLPVLILTASASLDIKVDSLELGADDYLVKPFEIRELVARIKALIRRQSRSGQSQLRCGDLLYDLDTRAFQAAGEPLTLTPREHRVLETLLLRMGKTVSKTQLAQAVFAPEDSGGEDAIEIYVHRLRRKLESTQARIVTLRGLGYLLRDADAP